MEVRVLIADDEEWCRAQLRRLLSLEDKVKIIAECSTGPETVNAVQGLTPDLIFLDIRMPELDGFGVLRELGSAPIPAVVFVSAANEFALQAFDSNAADYLLKPFDRERFQRAFQRALQRMAQWPVLPKKSMSRFTVKCGERFIFINPLEVEWITSADNYSELHLQGQTHLVRSTITAMAQQLAAHEFLQISRSTLVNVERVREISPKSHGDAVITLASGATLIATRTFRKCWAGLLQSVC